MSLDVLQTKKQMWLNEGDEIGKERYAYHLFTGRRTNYGFIHADIRVYRYRYVTRANGEVEAECASLNLSWQGDEGREAGEPKREVVGLYGYYGGGPSEGMGQYEETMTFLRFWKDEIIHSRGYGTMGLVTFLEWLHSKGYRPIEELEDQTLAYPGRRYYSNDERPAVSKDARQVYQEHLEAIKDARAHEQVWLQKEELDRQPKEAQATAA